MMKLLTIAMLVLAGAWWTLSPGAAAAAPETAPATQGAKELTLDLSSKVTLKLVQIPAGTFLMGSPDTEANRANDEAQHEVTISKPFYMGVFPVTVDQFAAFIQDSGYKTDAEKDGGSIGVEIRKGDIIVKRMEGISWRNLSFDQKGDHPVVQVSWADATAFCDWLSKKTGKKVCLPSEAQWEYARRAGSKAAYPWGDNPDEGKGWGNCADLGLQRRLPNVTTDWKCFNWDDGFIYTSPVGTFKPNAFGLYDMFGNVWQWCSDRYGDYDEAGAATDPTGPDSGGLHVLRGGSWFNDPAFCRAASRRSGDPAYRRDGDGFRVIVTAD